MAGAGWYPDPLGRAQVRYFDGSEWSPWAADNGQSRLDADAVLAGVPAPPDAPPPGMPPPPGTGWSPAVTAVQPYRAISGLSTAITWVLVVFVVAAAFGAGALAFRLDAIERFRDGDFTALADVHDGDDLVDASSSTLVVLNIALLVLVIIFLFRAVKNTEIWNAQKERWSPGWAIGGWFIPLANIVIPFLTFRETWQRSGTAQETGGRPPSTALLWAWWVLFIVGYIAIQIDPGGDEPTFDEIRVRDGFGIGGLVLQAVSAVLMILVVRRLAKWQSANAPSTV